MQLNPIAGMLSLAVIGVLCGSAAAWVWVISRRQRSQELLQFEPRQPVPWGHCDRMPADISGFQQPAPAAEREPFWKRILAWRPPHAIVLLLALLCLQVGGVRLALDWSRHGNREQRAVAGQSAAEVPSKAGDSANEYTSDEMRAMLIANAVVNVAFGLLVVIVLRLGRVRASWQDLGLPLTRFAYDVRVGLVGFFAIVVPVYMLQGLLGVFVKGEHPIVKFVRETHDWVSLAIAATTAVLIAPVVEELFFRVVLQGWLESTWPRDRHSPSIDRPADPQISAVAQVPAPAPIFWQPIVVSSAIFALLHAGHGPDPIPLFFLALVLGFIYQRTHRIWASVTLHFSLNFCSLLLLYIEQISKAV